MDVAHRHVGAHAFAHPFVEITGADRQTVIRQHGRDAHRGLAAIRQSVERDAPGIGERLLLEPGENLLVLADDDGEQRLAERVELALERAEPVLATIRIVRGKGDEALLGEPERERLVGPEGAG